MRGSLPHPALPQAFKLSIKAEEMKRAGHSFTHSTATAALQLLCPGEVDSKAKNIDVTMGDGTGPFVVNTAEHLQPTFEKLVQDGTIITIPTNGKMRDGSTGEVVLVKFHLLHDKRPALTRPRNAANNSDAWISLGHPAKFHSIPGFLGAVKRELETFGLTEVRAARCTVGTFNQSAPRTHVKFDLAGDGSEGALAALDWGRLKKAGLKFTLRGIEYMLDPRDISNSIARKSGFKKHQKCCWRPDYIDCNCGKGGKWVKPMQSLTTEAEERERVQALIAAGRVLPGPIASRIAPTFTNHHVAFSFLPYLSTCRYRRDLIEEKGKANHTLITLIASRV